MHLLTLSIAILGSDKSKEIYNDNDNDNDNEIILFGHREKTVKC